VVVSLVFLTHSLLDRGNTFSAVSRNSIQFSPSSGPIARRMVLLYSVLWAQKWATR
jgi:hypothetical protein